MFFLNISKQILTNGRHATQRLLKLYKGGGVKSYHRDLKICTCLQRGLGICVKVSFCSCRWGAEQLYQAIIPYSFHFNLSKTYSPNLSSYKLNMFNIFCLDNCEAPTLLAELQLELPGETWHLAGIPILVTRFIMHSV